MKSHDCHVFMEILLPVAFKELLRVHVWKAITEISLFFRDLCCSTITLSDIERLEHNIVEILCKLEKIFPPSFFNSMEHLPVHLPYEARLCGPVHYRWMYPFERFLNHLKRKIDNKARVEGSICMAYLAEEISNFCSNYFQDGVDTKTRDLPRNVNPDVESTLDENEPECFRVDCGRSSTGGVLRFMDEVELIRAHLYVLANTGILEDYERGFKEYIVKTRPTIRKKDVWVRHKVEFLEWFRKNVIEDKPDDVLFALAMGPSKRVHTWNQYYVNGYNFQTHEHGKHKSTQNYGVCVSNEEGGDYFGILQDVIELEFTSASRVYKNVLFKCSWMDPTRGMNIDHYKLVEVNHTKKYPKYDPFVLSYQAKQVYFATYSSLKKDRCQRWAVFKTKARSFVDALVDLDFLQETHVEAPTLSAPKNIPGYENGDDNSDDEDIPNLEPTLEESSFESIDSDDDEDYLFLNDDSDEDYYSDDGDS